ncbi:hypothetical protein WA845_23780 [Agrobacterium sp. CMT1]|uniref:hypothetical protein n=1 Tax=Agrobacterium sp. CMT1 TaxID=3128901 RepID=UPI0030785ABF
MEEFDRIRKAEEALLTAVDEAIEVAVKTVEPEVQSPVLRRSPGHYFADAVLRRMFLRVCGANPENYTGGDPDAAWKFLYMGRAVARHWERERGRPATLRKKKDRREDIERDASEQRQLSTSAHNFALKTAVRVLIAHARVSDPDIVDRINAVIDARQADIEPASEIDRRFTEEARLYVSSLARSPGRRER